MIDERTHPGLFTLQADGTYRPKTFEERQQDRREARYTETQHAAEVAKRQPKESNPYRIRQLSLERDLQVYGDDKDDKGKHLKSRAAHYKSLADKWDAEHSASKLIQFPQDIREAMTYVEANQERYLPEELVALRVRADIPRDPHGIADQMFRERLFEVELAVLARETKKQFEAREEWLKGEVDAARADVRVAESEQRLATAKNEVTE